MQRLHSLFDRHSEEYLRVLRHILAFIDRQQSAARREDVNLFEFCTFELEVKPSSHR